MGLKSILKAPCSTVYYSATLFVGVLSRRRSFASRPISLAPTSLVTRVSSRNLYGRRPLPVPIGGKLLVLGPTPFNLFVVVSVLQQLLTLLIRFRPPVRRLAQMWLLVKDPIPSLLTPCFMVIAAMNRLQTLPMTPRKTVRLLGATGSLSSTTLPQGLSPTPPSATFTPPNSLLAPTHGTHILTSLASAAVPVQIPLSV